MTHATSPWRPSHAFQYLAAARATQGAARPVLRRQDPGRQSKVQALRRLLKGLPADAVAVFAEEGDLNLNPKIGSRWMRRGQQAHVETPGDNDKRYLAG